VIAALFVSCIVLLALGVPVAFALGGGTLVALIVQGSVAMQRSRLDEAEAAFRKAADADPKSALAVYQLARLQILRSKRAEAIVSLKKAQQLDPNKQLGRAELAALEAGEDPGKVADTLERETRELLRAQPDQPALHTQLGAILLSKGKTDEAEAEFRSALKIAPRHVPALLSMARISLARKKPDEAMGFVRLALDVNPKDVEANLVAAHVAPGHPRRLVVDPDRRPPPQRQRHRQHPAPGRERLPALARRLHPACLPQRPSQRDVRLRRQRD
jgi:tetratricopeptide (TPR) repeat protein